MRSFYFSLLVMGAVAALIWHWCELNGAGTPAPDYPNEMRVINEVRPPHTMEAIEAQSE